MNSHGPDCTGPCASGAYGQPGEGVVTIEVDDETREMVKTILAEMEVV